MTKKKTDEFEVAMDAAVENNEEMEDVADICSLQTRMETRCCSR